MKYIEGNLLDLAEQGNFDIIVHGANCQNTMGSGIAKQVRDRYPKAYLVDQMTQKGDMMKLGKFTQAHIDGFTMVDAQGAMRSHTRHFSFTIINAYTQYWFGTEGPYLDYEAVTNIFKQIKLLYDMNPQAPCRIGIPKIGAGLAGGDWDIIEGIIDDMGFSDLTCVVYKEK